MSVVGLCVVTGAAVGTAPIVYVIEPVCALSLLICRPAGSSTLTLSVNDVQAALASSATEAMSPQAASAWSLSKASTEAMPIVAAVVSNVAAPATTPALLGTVFTASAIVRLPVAS